VAPLAASLPSVQSRTTGGELGGQMVENLTFEQVKKARMFAWHERHYVFANDTLLRVVTRYHTAAEATDRDPSPMIVRPSSLRG
jgi:hypothetical protein